MKNPNNRKAENLEAMNELKTWSRSMLKQCNRPTDWWTDRYLNEYTSNSPVRYKHIRQELAFRKAAQNARKGRPAPQRKDFYELA